MPSKTFFSYARDNGEFVLRLAKDLRASGVDLWLDQLDIPAGARWDSEIEKALDSAERLIVVLSADSVGSVNVMDEVSFALEHGKRVVPVLFQECKIPMRLRRLQHLDFTGDYQTGLTQLLKQLEVGSEAAKTSPPSSSPTPEPAVAEPVASSPELDSSGGSFPWKIAVPVVLVVAAGIIGWSQFSDREPEGNSGTRVVAGYEFEYAADAPVSACSGAIDPNEDWSTVELVNQSPRSVTAKWSVIDMEDRYSIDVEPGESIEATPMMGNELCVFDTGTSEEIVSVQIIEPKHRVEISE